MSETSQQLYKFLSACAGNWRNAIYISDNGTEYLLSADRDGGPIVMAAEQFQQLSGEQIDSAECCGQLTGTGFKALYGQYLLWHAASPQDWSLDHLCH